MPLIVPLIVFRTSQLGAARNGKNPVNAGKTAGNTGTLRVMTKFPTKSALEDCRQSYTEEQSSFASYEVAIYSSETDHSTTQHSLREIARQGLGRLARVRKNPARCIMRCTFFVAFFFVQVRTQLAV